MSSTTAMPSSPRSCRWPRAAACRASGGAKIQLIFADNQGTPAAGQNQALRLITEEKVAALIGAYQSGITLTASAIAERYGVPFLNAEIGRRQPHRARLQVVLPHHAGRHRLRRAYSTFLKEQKAAGQKVGSIALVHENTEYGNSVASVIADAFGKDGLPITQKIAYSANSTDVQPQVLQLKEKNPDVVIFISYTSDAILYAKTMKELNWKPRDPDRRQCRLQRPGLREGDGLGRRGPDQPLGLRRRQARQRRRPSSTSSTRRRPAATSSTTSRRAACRASWCWPTPSTAPARPSRPRSSAALKATNLPAEQLVAGYDGVKFDDKGQNVLASTLVTQLQRRQLRLGLAEGARHRRASILPYKGW